MNKNKLIGKKKCPGCGHIGGIYDFSPSIQIEPDNFRIFHFYSKMRGPLYCNQCKRIHLLKIADKKCLTDKQKKFLKLEILKNER